MDNQAFALKINFTDFYLVLLLLLIYMKTEKV